MLSPPWSREELTVRLVKIPSLTASLQENDAAVFIVHYDVVEVGVYGELAPWAFNPATENLL